MTLPRFLAPAAVLLAIAGGGLALTAGQATGSTAPLAADPGARQEAESLTTANRDLSRAGSVRIDQCMRTQDFSYPVEKPGQRVERDRAYGLSVDEAERTGYQSQSRILTLPDREPDIAPDDPAERKRFYLALFGPDDASTVEVEDPTAPGVRMGTSSAGCVSSAQRDLFGGDLAAAIRYGSVTGNFINHAEAEAGDDPAMDALNKRWSSCMKQAGQSYPAPDQAISAARGLASGSFAGLATGQAREIAVADAICQERTGYPAARSAIEEHHFRILLDQHSVAIAVVRESGRAATARAAAVLGDA